MNDFTLGFAIGTAMCSAGLLAASWAHARQAVQNAQPEIAKTTAGFTTIGAILLVVAGILLWPATPIAVVGAITVAAAVIVRARNDYAMALSYAEVSLADRRRR